MYNSKKTMRPKRRNEIRDFKVLLKGKTFKFTYNIDSLKDVLNSDVFDKIQIPVYVHNSILFGEGKKGVSVVGNVISYNDSEETMKVSIFNKFISKISTIDDAIISVRVAEVRQKDKEREEGEIVENIKVLGFDIASESFYAEI